VTLDWTQSTGSVWDVGISVPDDTVAANRGGATISFGAVSGNPVPEGTVGSVAGGTGSVTAGSYGAGSAATLTFTTDFGAGPQTISLNLGTYGQSNGVTQYAGTAFSLQGINQDGVPPGSFSSLTTTQSGDVVVNYNNGQARTIARVPVTTFNNPDALQRQDAQTFTTTVESGTPSAHDAGSNGAGGLVVSSVEDSNVDIATQFSKLIVAQRAYSANSKIVTTADELLQQTLDMKR
jgi:flagellar hook protein FlgE